ncbi:MAG: hypothetical protein KAS32_23335 [Candidatus Peribacteraceae bacterium]|nr:hypothetical protein [Candidatus Peribacteraceae bacterium]
METVKTITTYQIPEGNFEALVVKIEKVNRKAAKLGVDAVKLTLVRKYFETKKDGAYKYYEVTVEGKMPQLDGWRFIATLNHEHSDVMIRMLDTGVGIPEQYKNNNSFCEHCHTKRRRNDTFVIANDEKGELLRVGRQCLKDYIPTRTPEEIVRMAQYIDTTVYGEFESFDGVSDAYKYTPLMEYLPYVVNAIRKDGWLSNSSAGYHEVSTSSNAWSIIGQLDNPKVSREWKEQYRPTEADEDEAKKTIEWAKTLTDQEVGSYLYTLNLLAKDDYFNSYKESGYAAAMVMSCQREMGRLEEKKWEAKKSNEWIGNVKERLQLVLTVKDKQNIEGYYGTTILHTFEDEAGNNVKWFSSGVRFDIGETVTVKGTVKKHDEWKGRKQTVLTRVKEVLK